jgi:hypothetical protein
MYSVSGQRPAGALVVVLQDARVYSSSGVTKPERGGMGGGAEEWAQGGHLQLEEEQAEKPTRAASD